jgi:hypothetical protein
MSVLPRTGGPKSLVHLFGKVANVARADFVDSFKRATPEALLNDLLDQIHRNAEIACEKLAWVKRAMIWSLLATDPLCPRDRISD